MPIYGCTKLLYPWGVDADVNGARLLRLRICFGDFGSFIPARFRNEKSQILHYYLASRKILFLDAGEVFISGQRPTRLAPQSAKTEWYGRESI